MRFFPSIVCFVFTISIAKAQVTTAKVMNPCVALRPEQFTDDSKDKTFENFCIQVLTEGRYDITDSGNVVLKLLQSVKNREDREVCFIPFLKLIDTAATKKGDSLCIPSPWHKPKFYDGYCFKKKAAFIALFYVEFVLIRNEVISQRELMADLELEKEVGGTKLAVTSNYEEVLDLYTAWFSNTGKGKKKKHPLKGTAYKWKYSKTYKGRSFIRGDR
jgi:hypothetical protein